MFPEVKISEKDIESSWAGVRPLIYEEGKKASEISRKDEIWESNSGLLTIAGGKLTGYRKMAETIVNLVAAKYQAEEARSFSSCQTKHLPISGGNVGGSANFNTYVAEQINNGTAAGLTKAAAERLAAIYGSNVEIVYELVKQNKDAAAKTQLPLDLFAQLVYGIEHEMIATPIDFFNRRTGAILFNVDLVEKWKNQVTAYMAERLDWTEQEMKRYSISLEEALLATVIPVDNKNEYP
jgi:glycerol-3-phosphate dehydrogenase